jgi:uncharacterized OsmC-like protein
MALIDHSKLRANHEQVVNKLAAEPGYGLMRPTVSARLVRDVSVESSFVQYERTFTFLGDEARDRAGHETGPSPMRYFLSGIAFCLLGWWAKGSAMLDVELASLEVRVGTLLNLRGEHGFAEVPANPQWLVLEIEVGSPAPPESVLEVIDWGIAHCPLSVLVRRAIPVYDRVVHGGAVIRDSVPSEAA